MVLGEFLRSVVSGPSREVVQANYISGNKMRFVCRDEDSQIDEFYLVVRGGVKADSDSHTLVFAAIDTTGKTWSLSYDPENGEGDMVRTSGSSG